MIKVTTHLICFIVGIACSYSLFYLHSPYNIDFLSVKKDYFVKTKQNLTLSDGAGTNITIPVGTGLRFLSQYRQSGKFSLQIILSDLKNYEQYFEEREKNPLYFIQE